MANVVYPQFMLARGRGTSTEDLASAGVDVKVLYVDAAQYTYSDAHEFLSDIPAGARVAMSTALQNKTVARSGNDVNFVADDIDITIAAAAPTVEAAVILIDTGVAGTSRLLRYLDTGASFPFTPNPAGETRSHRFAATGYMRWTNP